ncbi:MAG: RNA polymerase sigma-70 factor [Gemmatimonadota bacterium]
MAPSARSRAFLTLRDTAIAEPDDSVLAARLAVGDAQALSQLLDRYWRQMVTFAADKVGSRDAAEDLVQEAFVRVWEHRAQLRPYTSPRGYLYRVLRNLITDDYRRRRLRDQWAAWQHQDGETLIPSPAMDLEADQLAAAASKAIAALPERRRDVFVLGHFHGLSYKEIAEALGITRRTVANHMSLALNELRRDLAVFLEAPGSAAHEAR